MCDGIAHRGPDDWRMYVRGAVGLGNRRLSIIDLECGHQSISNEDETAWIVFIGEIYKFPELRQELAQQGHLFRTNTDTEVIVHLCDEHVQREPVTRYGQQTAHFHGALRHRVYTPQVRNSFGLVDPFRVYHDRNGQGTGWESLDRIFYLDHTTYLPDDILAKVDIASMACSLETRPPFLDHRLMELAASLPVSAKMSDGQTKVLLRQIVADLLPHEILERPKVGFGLPMRQWMQSGELHDLSADLLHDQTFRQRALFSSAAVAEVFSQHQRGEQDYGHQLYQLLVFELWARAMLDQPVMGSVQL